MGRQDNGRQESQGRETAGSSGHHHAAQPVNLNFSAAKPRPARLSLFSGNLVRSDLLQLDSVEDNFLCADLRGTMQINYLEKEIRVNPR